MRKLLLISIVFFISKISLAQQEEFNDFLNKFSNDSIYQLNRTCFPLKKVFINDDTFELDSIIILKENYIISKFYYELYDNFDAYPVIYDNFKSKLRDSDERVFRWKGFSDMDERYYFKRLNGKWYLIKIEILGL